MSKFIITGTGRCGTTYCQAVLRVCGLNVTHQKYITFKEQKDLPDGVDGECSFMAVPYLENYKSKNYTIILLTRNIEKVVCSWQKRGCLRIGWEKFYPDFSKHVRNFSEGRTTIESMITWEQKARECCDYELAIESLTNKPNLLFEAIGRIDKFNKSLTDLIRTDANSDKH